MKFRCKKISDLPKGKKYEVKIRIKNHDLPKARASGKTINFNFPKVSKINKINCLELEREREREREREEYKNKVSRLAISKIIRTEHQNRAWLSLILYCM